MSMLIVPLKGLARRIPSLASQSRFRSYASPRIRHRPDGVRDDAQVLATRGVAPGRLESLDGKLVTAGRAGIRERAAGDGDELPGIARRVQRHLQNSPGAVVADLAVRDRWSERAAVAGAAGAGDDLADTVRVGDTARALRCEALVVVLVAVEHDVCVSGVEVVPDRAPERVTAMRRARRPPWLVPVREDARVRVCREVLLEPGLLGAAGAGVDGGTGCQRDQMPGAQVVRVVRRGDMRTEVGEVPGRARDVVFVISGCRARLRLESAPV